MELTNDFRVDVAPDTAWEVLTDVERIAPCMPGAQLEEVEGDDYRGVIKVKVGPITAQYKGTARMVEQDLGARRAVLRAEGRETRGQGNANATITATLEPDGGGTHVSVVTDLTITGKVAQFGRGVLADVSARLLQQFVDCLEADVLAAPADDASPPEGSFAPPPGEMTHNGEVRRITAPAAEPVDLMRTAGRPIARRAAPLVAVLFMAAWLLRRRRRRAPSQRRRARSRR